MQCLRERCRALGRNREGSVLRETKAGWSGPKMCFVWEEEKMYLFAWGEEKVYLPWDGAQKHRCSS